MVNKIGGAGTPPEGNVRILKLTERFFTNFYG
jgi:hypothetical protein